MRNWDNTMFDLIYVTYNSEKWIESCFASLLNQEYDLKKINVYVIDNASTDKTIDLLKKFNCSSGEKFASFNIIEEKENWGFGKANNIAFKKGKSEIVCFLNVDTEVFEDTFVMLKEEVDASEKDVAVWEFRQFPYEHPKTYDILTRETSWVSGAAFAIRRSVYEEVGGFDEKIFMYAEDVDLSWRVRTLGYKLYYVPKVKITHYSYQSAGEVKPTQHVYGVIYNLLLRYRYGDWKTVLMGHLMFWNLIRVPASFNGAKKMLLEQYVKHFGMISHFKAHNKYKDNGKEIAHFHIWDYSKVRDGAFYENFLPEKTPLVSIIVRTCGRPDVLRETLVSLRHQTYKNIEVVVVEDGESVSQKMIETEFSDLNILYKATGKKVGRSKAGNMAMAMANGEYLNFLDDDDLFYADHVEVLVANIVKSGCLAAYATSYETPVIVHSKSPYVYEVKDYRLVHRQEFDKVMLCHHNYIPIQCIMFAKSLFNEYGGLDETVDALEDWDLWVRYSLHTDFAFVLKTTSMYRVPANPKINAERQKALDDALIIMREKHKGYEQKLSVYDIARMYEK